MLFNSFEFLVFAILVIPIYYLLIHKLRWLWLLIASCVFYAYFIPSYLLILFSIIIIDYFAALKIDKANKKNKFYWLLLSLAANLGILFYFKYYNFFIDNINQLTAVLPFNKSNLHKLNIILPIGLSFHTFQAISYTIEVYRGKQKPEHHFGIYALYVMFFPQLVAGPIERPQNMLHQFHKPITFNYNVLKQGLKYVLLGLFMKSFIADRVAIPVDTFYNNYSNSWSGLASLTAATLFSIQIYCDFAGYSYMALGLAKMLGFEFSINFKQPYLSKNIAEFWKKWHISLSSWFKDYVYIPLGGNKVSKIEMIFNLIIIFTLSGLWHGANYTFLFWGLAHSLILICFNMFVLSNKIKINSTISILATFIFVTILWIFFRASNASIAFQILKSIVTPSSNYFKLYVNNDVHGIKGTFLGLPFLQFVFTLFLVPLTFIIDYLVSKNKLTKINFYSNWVQNAFYIFIIVSIIIFGVFNTKQFIYFQF